MPAAAIVVNPTKFDDPDAVRAQLTEVAAEVGWEEVRWYPTTEDDPGEGQAKQAITEGADLVCSLGGDGTVRAVASALVGTDTPLGLLPGGTGNLLARNLGLPIADLDEALRVALTGSDRRIDAGRISFDGRRPEVFVVMSGMGLDAETVDADEQLKARVGVLAYAAAGVKALVRPGFRVTVTDGERRLRSQHARMVVVGNCGKLTGGVELLPDAQVDDATLDALVFAPVGVLGWVAALTDVVTRHRRGHPRLRHLAGERFDVVAGAPVPCEIDGDVVGDHRRMEASVLPAALVVRVPSPEGVRP